MYEREKSEIQTLRSYLLGQVATIPLPPNDILLSSNSVALNAAVAGLDKELTRLEREERLVKKFTASENSNGALAGTVRGEDDADMDYVQMTKEDVCAADAPMDNMEDEEEWEEANPSPVEKHQRDSVGVGEKLAEGDPSAKLYKRLASSAVARIANASIRVSTPLGALGLGLHAALVELSDENSKEPIFRCTGVPGMDVTCQLLGATAKGKKGGGEGGFAPPIRELPWGELVPPNWEGNAADGDRAIAFRYKCGKKVYSTDSGHTNDATTVYLALQLLSGMEVSVIFGTLPSSFKDKLDPGQKLKFHLGKHVNLDGFHAAEAKNGGGSSMVSPSLFYISLPELLAKFNATFGVLLPKTAQKKAEDSTCKEMSMMVMRQVMPLPDSGMVMGQARPLPSSGVTRMNANAPYPSVPPDGTDVDRPNQTDPLRTVDPDYRGRGKDFEDDLLPGGPQHGGLPGVPPCGGGSQMGPDHPIFDRTLGDDSNGHEDIFGGSFGVGGDGFRVPGVGGGMGMRPRFDPYGPPGGLAQPGRGGRRFPGRGSRLGSSRWGRGRGRGCTPPGGFGSPNPDHMTPPGGDYFS